MQVKSICNTFDQRGAFCNTFALLSLRSLFCLFLSGCFRQVLLYVLFYCIDQDNNYSKPCIKRPLSKSPKLVFKINYRLMQVKSIAECSKGSILQYFRPNESLLQYFRPSFSYHLSLRYLFYLFLSGRFRQVLLYVLFYCIDQKNNYV